MLASAVRYVTVHDTTPSGLKFHHFRLRATIANAIAMPINTAYATWTATEAFAHLERQLERAK